LGRLPGKARLLYRCGRNAYQIGNLGLQHCAPHAPWQNGISERWVASCRREILDHVIALNEEHLRRLICDYVSYYHQDRIHDSLEKDTPDRRPVEHKPSSNAIVISNPRLGGLHHRYSWREAA
jgi:hypothetical protein